MAYQSEPAGQPGYAYPGTGPLDEESEKDMDDQVCMQAPEIRSKFIVKVYSLLSIQLIVTFAVAAAIRISVKEAPHGMITAAQGVGLATLVLLLAVTCCCSSLLRTFPINYLILAFVTLGVGCTCGCATVGYNVQSIILALTTTALVTVGLTAFACITKSDFTGMGAYLFAGLLVLILFPTVLFLVELLFGDVFGAFVQKAIAAVGVLLFSMYIVYDTQLIVGGHHRKHQFSIDDYVFAVLSIYLDIINMFLYLLQLFGGRK